eukprot:6582070-Prymnesium_polylepis.1
MPPARRALAPGSQSQHSSATRRPPHARPLEALRPQASSSSSCPSAPALPPAPVLVLVLDRATAAAALMLAQAALVLAWRSSWTLVRRLAPVRAWRSRPGRGPPPRPSVLGQPSQRVGVFRRSSSAPPSSRPAPPSTFRASPSCCPSRLREVR